MSNEKKIIDIHDHEFLERIKKLLGEKENDSVLNEDEINTLKSMIRIYESFGAFGRFSGAIKNIVLYIGGFLVAWFVLVDNLSIIWQKILHALVIG